MVRRSDDNSRRKVQNVRGDSSAGQRVQAVDEKRDRRLADAGPHGMNALQVNAGGSNTLMISASIASRDG
jgi:hypothetical protein